MGKPKIGDKFFIYGQFMTYLEEFDVQYNTVMGYMTIGGYDVTAVETDEPLASLPGFLIDAQFTHSLGAVAAPFSQMEMVDITEKLSLSLPLPSGTKVWLPTL